MTFDFDAAARALRDACPDLSLRAREPMSAHTSLRIGGPATLMAFPASIEELCLCLRTAEERGLPLLFIVYRLHPTVPALWSTMIAYV